MRGNNTPRRSVAIVCLAAALAISMAVTVFSTMISNQPTLVFSGFEFRVMSDGSVQGLVDIYMENVPFGKATSYQLEYAPQYLIPSDMSTNQVLQTNGAVTEESFFCVDGELFGTTPDGSVFDPFARKAYDLSDQMSDRSILDTLNHRITMTLALDTQEIWKNWPKRGNKPQSQEKGNLHIITATEADTPYFYFDSSSQPVRLGTLSFWIDPSQLQTVVDKFKDGSAADGDFLLRLSKADNWNMRGYQRVDAETDIFDETIYNAAMKNASVDFRFQFPPTLVKAAAAEPEVTLNAYQAYTDGTLDDVARILQKESPMVTATYADGTVENFLMAWGNETAGHDYKVYRYTAAGDHRGDVVTAANYLATGGEYLVEQYFHYQTTDLEGQAVVVRFPVPITVHLTVTPIKVTGVTANRLAASYGLTQAATTYTAFDTLALPTEARLTTDVVPGSVSLTLPIPGWDPTVTDMRTLTPDGYTPPTDGADPERHWPGPTDDITTHPEHFTGTYSFSYDKGADVAGRHQITPDDIHASYPWLTAESPYSLKAVRKLVGDGAITDAAQYRATYESTDATGKLTLSVRRNNDATMAADSHFRVLLPNGMELGNGIDGNQNWFTQSGNYQENSKDLGTGTDIYFEIDTAPGAAGGSFSAQREVLRRSINLGGWFQIAVREDPDKEWSGFMPVYVPPRTNQHTQSKTYDFTGLNAGLYPYHGSLSTTITLPRGAYVPVGPDGSLQVDSDGKPVYERYGASTTYDGGTGAEPGQLYTFRLDKSGLASWPSTATPGRHIYGPAPFVDGAAYTGYGKVANPAGSYQAELRFPASDPRVEVESVKVYPARPGVDTGISTHADGQVDTAVYNTKQVGYPDRQEYTFLLENDGTTDLNGLYIDTGSIDDGRGHFVVTKAPAQFLAPGQTTSFTMTYVYGLDVASGQKNTAYIDTIGVCTDASGPDAPLRTFQARFTVSNQVVSTVTVLWRPAGGEMGTAGLILGEQTADGEKTMDYSAAASTYATEDTVYLAAYPLDEYAVAKGDGGAHQVYYFNAAGDKVYANLYATDQAEIDPRKPVYSFQMPAHNVTVYVEYYEPLASKLRLSDLSPYGADEEAKLDPLTAEAYRQPWQKTFSADQAGAGDFDKLFLGAAGTAGFQSSQGHYLVVLDHSDAWARISTTLRAVTYLQDGNLAIAPEVVMTLYRDKNSAGEPIYTGTGQTNRADDPATPEDETNTPTTHVSDPFESPEPGRSVYVVITLTFDDTPTATQHPEGSVSRSYYVELVRRTDSVTGRPGYGNSPYGMIMNAANIGDSLKAKAKEAFVTNGYRFTGDAHTPTLAQPLRDLTYWTEAWLADVDSRYEPESHTALGDYDPARNLDLDDTALFVYLDEAFTDPGLVGVKDSSMRDVPASAIHRRVTVTLLDTDATAQAHRFAGPADADALAARTAVIDLGTADAADLDEGWSVVQPAPAGEGETPPAPIHVAIRPGVYDLEYTFPDYDGGGTCLIRRKLVILGRPGDVNADGRVEAGAAQGTDERDLKDRMTDPLGYTAAGYPDAALFRYRTCDANNDRNVNDIDANQLRNTKTEIRSCYLPVGYR